MQEGRLTVCCAAEIRLEVKKSVFIAAVAPIEDEKEASDFLRHRRELHKDARHHVYAYRVTAEDGQCRQRYSDDGEPAGTAGLPVFQVLNFGEIFDTVLVVTRYFGGTLLGAGGLVRAYGQAAAEAVETAGIARSEAFYSYLVCCDYATHALIEDRFGRRGYEITERRFAADVELMTDVPAGECAFFEDWVSEISRCTVRLKKGSLFYKKKILESAKN